MTARIGRPQQCRSRPMKGAGGRPVGKQVAPPPDGCCSCCIQMIYFGIAGGACGDVAGCDNNLAHGHGYQAGIGSSNSGCEEISFDGDTCPDDYLITRTVQVFNNGSLCTFFQVTFSVVAHDTGGQFIQVYSGAVGSAYINIRMNARPHALGSCDSSDTCAQKRKTGFWFDNTVSTDRCADPQKFYDDNAGDPTYAFPNWLGYFSCFGSPAVGPKRWLRECP